MIYFVMFCCYNKSEIKKNESLVVFSDVILNISWFVLGYMNLFWFLLWLMREFICYLNYKKYKKRFISSFFNVYNIWLICFLLYEFFVILRGDLYNYKRYFF